MGAIIVSEPAAEPISTSEAKLFLRVDHSSEDTLIASLIKAARRYCERVTKRVFVTQSWDLWLDRFPVTLSRDAEWWDGARDGAINDLHSLKPGPILIPVSPVQSVTSIKTYDADDASATVDASVYFLDKTNPVARIGLRSGQSWPTSLRLMNGVQVSFTAGYGAAAAVPEDLKQAIYLLVSHFYEHRSISPEEAEAKIPVALNHLLSPYKVVRL